MKKPRETRIARTFRLTTTCDALLSELATENGISRTDALELSVRAYAKKAGISLPTQGNTKEGRE